MKDFNFHTAHLKYTVGKALIDILGEKGEQVVELAVQDFVDTFGQRCIRRPLSYSIILGRPIVNKIKPARNRWFY